MRQIAALIDAEVQKIIHDSHDRASQLLHDHRKQFVYLEPRDFVPMNFSIGRGYNAIKPGYVADWFARF